MKSGVFRALGRETRSPLQAISPIIWSVDCDVQDPGSDVQIRRVSALEAGARITRERGTIGIILQARTQGDAEAQILASRQVSRRIPLLVFCPEPQIFDGVVGSFGATTSLHVLGSAEALEALRAFITACERHARWQHEHIAAFAAWRGLTSSEADLLYRLAIGVRPFDMHGAQGVGVDTKKGRIADVRAKCWDLSLEEIFDIALNRLSPA